MNKKIDTSVVGGALVSLVIFLTLFFAVVLPESHHWYVWVILVISGFMGWFVFGNGWRKIFPKHKK
jgi:hypothetical protein